MLQFPCSVVSSTVVRNETDGTACFFPKADSSLTSQRINKSEMSHFLSLGPLRNQTKILNYSSVLLSSGAFLYCLEKQQTRPPQHCESADSGYTYTRTRNLSYSHFPCFLPTIMANVGVGVMLDNLGLKILLQRFLPLSRNPFSTKSWLVQ